MTSYAKTLAEQCSFALNTDIGGGGYGQNLFAGSDQVGEAITASW